MIDVRPRRPADGPGARSMHPMHLPKILPALLGFSFVFAFGCGGASTEPITTTTTDTASPTATPTAAAPTADPAPTGATGTEPAGSGSCIEDCVKSRQMQAISIEQIRKNCEADCAKK